MDEFDYIIIDTPPSLGLLSINAMCAANWVMVPVQAEYYALEGFSMLMNSIKMIPLAAGSSKCPRRYKLFPVPQAGNLSLKAFRSLVAKSLMFQFGLLTLRNFIFST